MTKDELLAILQRCGKTSDWEAAHGDADDALIAYINDLAIAEAYRAVGKWYA